MVVDEKVLWSLCWRYSVDRVKAAKWLEVIHFLCDPACLGGEHCHDRWRCSVGIKKRWIPSDFMLMSSDAVQQQLAGNQGSSTATPYHAEHVAWQPDQSLTLKIKFLVWSGCVVASNSWQRRKGWNVVMFWFLLFFSLWHHLREFIRSGSLWSLEGLYSYISICSSTPPQILYKYHIHPDEIKALKCMLTSYFHQNFNDYILNLNEWWQLYGCHCMATQQHVLVCWSHQLFQLEGET